MKCKNISLIVLVLLLAVAPVLFAAGAQEEAPEPEPVAPVVEEPAGPEAAPVAEQTPKATVSGETVAVNMAVFKGPSGFGFVKLIEEGADLVDGITVDTQVLPSPTEAIARLASNELDVVAMPINAAASIYNKGIDVRLAAVTGEGMLYLLSNSDTITTAVSSAAGAVINVPGAGSTPEYVPKYVFGENGLAVGDGVEFDFSLNVAPQLAQMLIAGKVESAVLPEPFATMAETKGANVNRTIDFQSEWAKITGNANYPMTALLIRGEFMKENPDAVRVIRLAVEDSIDWVNANPSDAAVLIEKHGILTAALAEPAIPNCNLIYIDAMDAKDSIEAYLTVLKDYDASSIGGALPDEAFYLAK